jgi:hypothetical protein
MVKGESSRVQRSSGKKIADQGNYDYLKEIITLANKNGVDMESLNIVPRDLPSDNAGKLTAKQRKQRSSLVRKILKKFDEVLTPPVPPDLEHFIRTKSKEDLLPWEKEALEKLEEWRSEIMELKPAILEELSKAWYATRTGQGADIQ